MLCFLKRSCRDFTFLLTGTGIPRIRHRAQVVRPIFASKLSTILERKPISRKIMDREQNLELLIRRCIAGEFEDMDLQLVPTQKEQLRKALFEICFPLEIVIRRESS